MKGASDEQSGAQTNKQLVAAPQFRDQAGNLGTDDETEHIVVGVEFSASAALNFYVQNANGSGGRKGVTFFTGANSGDFAKTWLPMGKGNPIKYTSSAGTLSIRVLYITRRYTSRKPA